MPGIEIIYECDFNTVFSYWPEHIHDFGDAVIAYVGKIIKESAILTFDQKFMEQLKTIGLVGLAL